MSRRIRPKIRPKPSSVKAEGKNRIKIRRGRDSDAMEQAIQKAAKELSKHASFKAFKSGVKSGKGSMQKKVGVLETELNNTRSRLASSESVGMVLSGRIRVLEKALSAMVDNDDAFGTRVLTGLQAQHVLMRMRAEETVQATNKWILVWDDSAVTRDEDGVDRVTSTFTRHRLHPGRKIPIREMHPIWDALPLNEVPDVDPMQGMRNAWYYNRRRYSSHGAAMNAWRRHMHRRMEGNTIPEGVPSTYIPPAHEQLDEDIPLAEERGEDRNPAFDDIYREINAEEDLDNEERERRRNNMRNRLNGLLRSHNVDRVSYWTREYSWNMNTIEDIAREDMNPHQRVYSHFAVPLEDWDDDNWAAFRQDISYYLETNRNGRPRRARRARVSERSRQRRARRYASDS